MSFDLGAMRKILSNYFLTILSLSLVLFLLGLYLMMLTQSARITDQLKENINIVVELVEAYPENSKTELIQQLEANQGVLSNSVQFLTKEDAKEIMIGDEEFIFLDDSLQNPFRDAIVLNLKADNYNKEYIENFSVVVESEDIVSEVYYQEDLFSVVSNNLRKFSWIVLVIGVFMMLLAILLIYNTVNLSLMGDKQKIQTMELVGAERSYIKKPYIISSIKTGLISFSIAACLLIAVLSFMALNFQFMSAAINYGYLIGIFGLLLLISLLIPFISTNKFVISHLNKI